MKRIHHSRLRQLRAEYLCDLRRLRNIARLPPARIIDLLAAERAGRYDREREKLERRIDAATQASPPAIADEQLQAWVLRYRTRRPRECARLGLQGLAMRLQREHPELTSYSPDWLRQRLARLQEAMPPATERRAESHTGPA